MYVSCDSAPFSGINQRRKTCRKVLTSRPIAEKGWKRGRGEPFASKRGLSRRPYRVVPGGIFSFSAWSCLTRTIHWIAPILPGYMWARRRRRMGASKEQRGSGGRGRREGGRNGAQLALIGGRAWQDKLIVLSVCNGCCRASLPLPPLPKLSPLYSARVFVSRICCSRRWQLQRARANLSRIAF